MKPFGRKQRRGLQRHDRETWTKVGKRSVRRRGISPVSSAPQYRHVDGEAGTDRAVQDVDGGSGDPQVP